MSNIQIGVLLLSLMITACQKKTPTNTTTQETATAGQVLKVFKIQDIQDGLVAMELQAPEAVLSDETQTAELTQPVIRFMKQGKITATLEAAHGRVHMQTHHMTSWGGVVVQTPDKAILRVERLRYDPDRDRLLSDDPLMIEKPGSVTHGVGLVATPDLRSIKIGRQRALVKGATLQKKGAL